MNILLMITTPTGKEYAIIYPTVSGSVKGRTPWLSFGEGRVGVVQGSLIFIRRFVLRSRIFDHSHALAHLSIRAGGCLCSPGPSAPVSIPPSVGFDAGRLSVWGSSCMMGALSVRDREQQPWPLAPYSILTAPIFSMFLLDKIFLGGKFWGPIGKTGGQNRTTHTTSSLCFSASSRIGLRFVPCCCIRRQVALLELRKREIQRASASERSESRHARVAHVRLRRAMVHAVQRRVPAPRDLPSDSRCRCVRAQCASPRRACVGPW